MFLDASAIVAILLKEADWQELHLRIAQAKGPFYFSGMVRYEASQAIGRSRAGKRKPSAGQLAEASASVNEFLDEVEATPIAIDDAISWLAMEASAIYGKAVGHPADLNMGDCFAYACAKSLNVPLLYKGEDFAKTDLA